MLQGLTNEIYDSIDSHNIGKGMWDEIAIQMHRSTLSVRSKITNVLIAYESFQAKEGELLEHTYNRYYNLLNEIRKYEFSKGPLEINKVVD